MKDFHHNHAVVHAIAVQSLGATGSGGKTSKIIDRAGYDAVELIYSYGTVTATSATVGVTVKDGDATNALSVVTASLLLGTVASAGLPAGVRASGVNKNFARGIGYMGMKRYVQTIMAPTASGGIIAGANAILTNPRTAPTPVGS